MTDRKLVLVFDNLDRLPITRAAETWSTLWSLLEIMTARKMRESNKPAWSSRTWVIVPYAREFLPAPNLGVGEKADESPDPAVDFSAKAFQMRLHVPSPIHLDQQKYFVGLYIDAFGPGSREEAFRVFRVFESCSKTPYKATPRQLKSFLNDLVALGLVWQGQIPAHHLAAYTVKRAEIESNYRSVLREEFTAGPLGQLPDSQNLVSNLLSIFFGVAPPRGIEVALNSEIAGAINVGTAKTLKEYEALPGLSLALAQYIRANIPSWKEVQPRLLARAGAVIDELPEEIKSELWRDVGNELSVVFNGASAWGLIEKSDARGLLAIAEGADVNEEPVTAAIRQWSKQAIDVNREELDFERFTEGLEYLSHSLRERNWEACFDVLRVPPPVEVYVESIASRDIKSELKEPFLVPAFDGARALLEWIGSSLSDTEEAAKIVAVALTALNWIESDIDWSEAVQAAQQLVATQAGTTLEEFHAATSLLFILAYKGRKSGAKDVLQSLVNSGWITHWIGTLEPTDMHELAWPVLAIIFLASPNDNLAQRPAGAAGEQYFLDCFSRDAGFKGLLEASLLLARLCGVDVELARRFSTWNLPNIAYDAWLSVAAYDAKKIAVEDILDTIPKIIDEVQVDEEGEELYLNVLREDEGARCLEEPWKISRVRGYTIVAQHLKSLEDGQRARTKFLTRLGDKLNEEYEELVNVSAEDLPLLSELVREIHSEIGSEWLGHHWQEKLRSLVGECSAGSVDATIVQDEVSIIRALTADNMELLLQYIRDDAIRAGEDDLPKARNMLETITECCLETEIFEKEKDELVRRVLIPALRSDEEDMHRWATDFLNKFSGLRKPRNTALKQTLSELLAEENKSSEDDKSE